MTYVKTGWTTGDIITAEKLNNMESGIENANSGAYVKTEWETGDIITAEKLNHMESGIENANSAGAEIDAIIDGSATTVVSNAKTVRRYAFYFVGNTEKFILNEVEKLEAYSLYGTGAKIYMPKLKQIVANGIGPYARTKFYLPSTASNIASSAFSGSPQITDIYCDFAQGDVSGAPWGATGATVHYNVPYPASIDEME